MKKSEILFLALLGIAILSPISFIDWWRFKQNTPSIVYGFYGTIIAFLFILLVVYIATPLIRRLLSREFDRFIVEIRNPIIDLIQKLKDGDIEQTKEISKNVSNSLSERYTNFLMKRLIFRSFFAAVAISGAFAGSMLIYMQNNELAKSRRLNEDIWHSQQKATMTSILYDADIDRECPSETKYIREFVELEHLCMNSGIRSRELALYAFLRLNRERNNSTRKEANLIGLRMSGAYFGGANDPGDLFGGIYDRSYFVGSRLVGVSIGSSQFNRSYFDGALLNIVRGNEIEAKDASFRGTSFTYSDFKLSDFARSNFTNADFTGADFSQANLCNTNLTNVNFSEANLEKTNLAGAYMLTPDGKRFFDSSLLSKAKNLDQVLLDSAQCKALGLGGCRIGSECPQ